MNLGEINVEMCDFYLFRCGSYYKARCFQLSGIHGRVLHLFIAGFLAACPCYTHFVETPTPAPDFTVDNGVACDF